MSYAMNGFGSYYLMPQSGAAVSGLGYSPDPRGRRKVIWGSSAGFGSYGGLGAAYMDGDTAKWIIQTGDIVSAVAQKVYGSALAWPAVAKANPNAKQDPGTPPGDFRPRVGEILTLPLVPGYPNPADAIKGGGVAVVPAGTVVPGGTVGSGGSTQAGMGTKVMIAALAVVAIGAIAIVAKKKRGSASSTFRSSTTTYRLLPPKPVVPHHSHHPVHHASHH